MSKYGLKTLVTEHIPDLQIGTSGAGGGNLEIQELVPDKCLSNTQEKSIILAYPWMPACENYFYNGTETDPLARPQLFYAVDSDSRTYQLAPIYLEGDGISDCDAITVYPTSFIESVPPESLTGFEEIPYEELGFKAVGLPICYPEPKSSVKSRSASAPSLSEMIERTRERFGLK